MVLAITKPTLTHRRVRKELKMGILEGLFGEKGGGLAAFAKRFEGGGSDVFSDQEAAQHHGAVAERLPAEHYQQAAEDALTQFSPEQRTQLVDHLREQARQQDVNFPTLHEEQRLHEPGLLAGLFGRMQQQQPGLLEQLLGGGGGRGGGTFANPIAKMALASIAAMGIRRILGRRQEGE
jgi:hypothetical protein